MASSPVTKVQAQPGPTPGPTGQAVVTDAMQYLGSPYVFGGNPYSIGQLLTDCSGLVDRVWADLGFKLPGARPTTADLVKMGSPVSSLSQAVPGDLIFLEGGDHVGIYAGNNQMIQDPQPGQAVDVVPVYQTPVAIRRLTAGAQPAGGGGPATGTTPAGASGSAGVVPGLTGWLDSVAVRVGAVVLGAALIILGLMIAIPGHPAATIARRAAELA